MPQDYNIYIRNMNTGGQSDPTRPWNQNGNGELQPTVAWNTEDGSIQQQISMGMNPAQLAAMGTSQALKAVAPIAVGYVVVKNLVKALSGATTFVSEVMAVQSGNFGYLHGIRNLRQEWQNFTHPFSTYINIAREENIRRIDNERRTLNIALLGETMINRGV